MNSKLVAGAILIASTATAADLMPASGSFGFNWLDAKSQCKKLTEKDLAQFSKCTPSNNAFGLQSHSHACRVNSKIEYIVYQNLAQCQEALETMQANGP